MNVLSELGVTHFLLSIPLLAPTPGPAPASEVIELHARWEPMTAALYRNHERIPALAPVARPEPAEHARSYSPELFGALIPAQEIEVGEVWELDARSLLPLLSQFHPGATTSMRHPHSVEGAHAVLLSRDGEVSEVLLRMHAEFELESGAHLLPAQFEARAHFHRGERLPRAFELRLPPRDTNADVTARDPEHGFIVAGIGFIPRMELTGGIELMPELDQALLEKGRHQLALAFYPSARIEWLPLATAVERSVAESRPLHVVLLFGSLDDESC